MADTLHIHKNSEIGAWFNALIDEIEFLQLQLETGIATHELKKVYDTLRGGDPTEIHHLNTEMAQKFFMAQVIQDYLKITEGTPLKKLAFSPDNSQILVWAEIENDDGKTEKAMILAEAEINAKYHVHGWTLDTTIVESSDQIPVPTNYKAIKIPAIA